MNSKIITASGMVFDILNPSKDDISVNDIAHALSMQCRFNGHCKKFYSVAQHSVRVAQLLSDAGYSARHVKLALIHDATEAYIGDVVTPLKNQLDKYIEIEKAVDSVIREKFDLGGNVDEEYGIVKQADQAMLYAERRDLLEASDMKWEDYDGQFSVNLIQPIVPLDPINAKWLYLNAIHSFTSMK